MAPPTPIIIRPADIQAVAGISRTQAYDLERAGRFPRRIRLSARCVGWRMEDVQRWLAERPAAADSTEAPAKPRKRRAGCPA
ncbi:helix-turn-helix transcriptional regulator [Plasticicumulans lactativorans]|uniref:helix-turn-helix transcriptional regulator n=1 Tax=Plasticicumulans lactativorans TaxID=1133106 RepID=UPI001050121C|nr:AlpA family phage regulatory protein [Plasticicumulans lactativorans]